MRARKYDAGAQIRHGHERRDGQQHEGVCVHARFLDLVLSLRCTQKSLRGRSRATNCGVARAIMDYSALTRKQLQAEAKKRGVKANGKSVDIIEALKELDAPCDAPPVARDVEMAPEEVAVINAINAFAAAESAPPCGRHRRRLRREGTRRHGARPAQCTGEKRVLSGC